MVILRKLLKNREKISKMPKNDKLVVEIDKPPDSL